MLPSFHVTARRAAPSDFIQSQPERWPSAFSTFTAGMRRPSVGSSTGRSLRMAAELREGSLPSSCLLSLVVGQQGADAATGYPERSQTADHTITSRREIRVAVDVNRKRVIFNRWGEIKGVGAELLIFLASLHRQAASDEVAPERYPFAKTRDVLGKLRIDSEETLRRRVFRCRKQIEKLATNAGDPLPAIDDVIENHQWRGYRLNPDVIRIWRARGSCASRPNA